MGNMYEEVMYSLWDRLKLAVSCFPIKICGTISEYLRNIAVNLLEFFKEIFRKRTF